MTVPKRLCVQRLGRMRRHFALLLTVGGLAALALVASPATAQRESESPGEAPPARVVTGPSTPSTSPAGGDEKSFPDKASDFVNDHIEFFVGGLLAAIIALLIVVTVTQRREKARTGRGPKPVTEDATTAAPGAGARAPSAAAGEPE